MKKNIYKVFYSFIGGIFLYILSLVFIFVNYMDLAYDMQEIILAISFAIGMIVSIFVTLYKNKTIGGEIVSLILLITFWFGILGLNGYLGTVLWLENLLDLHIPYEDNASGLIVVLFIYLNCISSVIAIIIKALVKCLIKRVYKNWR